MKRNYKMTLVAVIAAAVVMLTGAGYAFAQSDDAGGAPAQGADPAAAAPCGPGGGPGGRLGQHLVGGEVVSVDGDTITIKTRDGEEKKVRVDDQTRYRKDGQDATKEDVQPGVKIGVMIGQQPAEGEDPLAKAVMIGEPPAGGAGPGGMREQALVGTVKSLDGDTLTITTAEGDKQVKLPAIAAGQRIAVVPGTDGSAKVVMYNPPERPQGQQGQAPAADPAAGNNA